MRLFDHIGISVDDLPRSIAQFDPVMQALGCTRRDADGSVSWYRDEDELILYSAREPGSGPHRHGRVGWQHLAFPVDSRNEVDRLHQVAIEAGWTAVSGPKPRPVARPMAATVNFFVVIWSPHVAWFRSGRFAAASGSSVRRSRRPHAVPACGCSPIRSVRRRSAGRR